jgi:hypothetical protein
MPSSSTADDAPLTFFELLTVLAFVAFADAPIDVLVLEVGMGGAWDSTNTADGDVAVFAPIDIDHADRLGETIARDRDVKAGIIKDGAAWCRRARIRRRSRAASAAAARGATIAFEGGLRAHRAALAVGGQLISVRGLAGTYDGEYLPLYGGHQGFNAALAIAAVESLIGGASQPIVGDILATARSGDVSRAAAARRDRPDGAGGCRAQPARRARTRPRRCVTPSTSTSGAWFSACWTTRTRRASSRSSRPSRPMSSQRRRARIARAIPTGSPTSLRHSTCR